VRAGRRRRGLRATWTGVAPRPRGADPPFEAGEGERGRALRGAIPGRAELRQDGSRGAGTGALAMWGYALAWFVFNDAVKRWTHRGLRRS